MSRVGKNPVVIPDGVNVEVSGGKLSAKGKLGVLTMGLSSEVSVKIENGQVLVQPVGSSKRARMMWGTTRNLVRNMVTGVATGYSKALEISGVGYRAAVQGKDLILQLGYSHEIKYPIPEGITVKAEKPTALTISGADRQKVGQVAAEIRSFRGPEPYKGKGIKYDTETILRKEGKKK
jgi:large subunit ribosomal protein L6